MANLTENTFLHPQPDVDNLTTSFSTQSLEENKSKEKDTKSAVKKLSDIQFLVMITHLAGAEIRFILDSTKKDISENDNESLPLLYSLLEGVVQYLVVEDSVQLGEKVLESLKNALYETYLAVASFLSERWDVYQMAQDKGAIDNMTTLFTIGAYSRWIAEETSVTPEEMETLVPLIVWVLEQKSFDSLQTDPFNLIAELLAFITSETVTLDAFLKLEGLTFTVSHFKTAETDIQRLEIAAILLNIVVSSDVNTLERYGEVLRELFPILINLMTSGNLH
ncbi:hypothetical protein BC833DRAFT_301749 [Globomyces pollinis-pini]|nr:hypothetical protein BC833DRAFT_301749 [Globomyces pollinis-pini]